MKLTKEYLAEQKDCIQRNYDVHIGWGIKPNIRERYLTLRKFCEGHKTILSVGSGGVEPVAIHATHACDVHKLAGDLLKSQNWPGIFFISSCDDIAALNKEFDVAVCGEVIEHLPDLEIVRKTFSELDRVAWNWIVTTPAVSVVEPTHRFLFTKKDLKNLTKNLKVRIIKKGIYWYVIKE